MSTMSQKPDEGDSAPLVPASTTQSSDVKWTVDEALGYIGTGWFQYLLLCWFGISYTSQAAETVLMTFLSKDAKCDMGLTSDQEEMITTAIFLGMAAGSCIFGGLSDLIGRKPGAFLIVGTATVSGLATPLARDYTMLVTARFFVGVGLGGFILLLSYFSEFLPLKKRGQLMTWYQLFWTIGIGFIAATEWLVMPKYHWQGLALTAAIPLVILMLTFPLIPESPRFLVVNGKEEEAKKVLQQIAQANGVSFPMEIRLLASDMPADEQKSKFSQAMEQLRMLFTAPLNKVTPPLWFIWVGASVGYYGVMQLTATALRIDDDECDASGKHMKFRNSTYIDIAISSAAETAAFVVLIQSVDRFGRHKTLWISFLSAGLSMFVFPYNTRIMKDIALFSARFFLSLMYDCLIIFVPELYPTSFRSSAVGLGNFFSRFGGAVSPYLSKSAYNAFGAAVVFYSHGWYYLFLSLSAFMIPYDTTNMPLSDTLEELTEELSKGSTFRHNTVEI